MVPSVQPQSRGCAAAVVVAAALVLVLLVAGVVWYAVARGAPDNGDYDAAPECEVGETRALDQLVPRHEVELEEPVGGSQDPAGSGWQCRWATPEGPGEEVPGVATLVVVAAPNPGGVTTASETLRTTTSQHETREVDGIGDEAVTWLEQDPYKRSCVGTRVSNLYLEACYSVAASYSGSFSGDEERIIAGAEQFAASVAEALPE